MKLLLESVSSKSDLTVHDGEIDLINSASLSDVELKLGGLLVISIDVVSGR